MLYFLAFLYPPCLQLYLSKLYYIVGLQSASNNQTPSQGPATSESNNLTVSRPSSCLGFTKPNCYDGSKDIQFMDQSVLMKSQGVEATLTKADIELLARNRGSAMQRYKEKKKTRR